MRKFYFLLILFQGFFAMENKNNNNSKDEEVEMIDTCSRPKNHGTFNTYDPRDQDEQLARQIAQQQLEEADEILANQMFYEMLDTNPKSESLMDKLNGYGFSSNENLENQILENQWENENLQNQIFDNEILNGFSNGKNPNENLINQNPKIYNKIIANNFANQFVALMAANVNPQVNSDSIMTTITEYQKDLNHCRVLFHNMVFPEMYDNATITPQTILDYELEDINRKLDGTIDEQSDQSLKDKIQELKSQIQKHYEHLKTNLIKAQSENKRFATDPNDGLSFAEINPPVDSIEIQSFPLITTINQIQGEILKSIPFIDKLENNNETLLRFNLIKNNIPFSFSSSKYQIQQWKNDWMAKTERNNLRKDNKLHINSTINNKFIEENFKWNNFSLFKFSEWSHIHETTQKSVTLLFVPNDAKFIMASLEKYDSQIIKVVNDFFTTTPKELLFLLNFSKDILNTISPQFHVYFSILNQIYSNPLLYKMFFTIFKLSEIEQSKKAFQWRQSYGRCFPEGNIEELLPPKFKFGMSGPIRNEKISQDGLLLQAILNPKKNFKNLINEEGIVLDFFQGPWNKKDLLDATSNFLMQWMDNYQLQSQIGLLEKLFGGFYSVKSEDSDTLFGDIDFGLPKTKDDTAIKKPSKFKEFCASYNQRIRKNLLLYYLCQKNKNKYIYENFSNGINVKMVKKEMDKQKMSHCPKTQEIASYYNDFLILFEKKFQKARDKVNHLKNAQLSPRDDVIFADPNNEAMVKKLINFLDISDFNPVLAFIHFLQSRKIKFHGRKNHLDLNSLQTFASEEAGHMEDINTNIRTLYNFLEEQTVAQKKPMHFAKIDFLMPFILRPDWVIKQDILLKYFTYFHSQEFKFFQFDKMSSDGAYLRYLVNEKPNQNVFTDTFDTPSDIFARILENKTPENINVLKIVTLMGSCFHYGAIDNSVLCMNHCIDEKIYEWGSSGINWNHLNRDQQKIQEHSGLIHPNIKKITNYDFHHKNYKNNRDKLYKCVQNYSNNFSLINSNPFIFTSGFTNVLLNHHMDLFVKLLHYSFQRNNTGLKYYGWRDGDHFNFQNVEVYNQIQKLSHIIAIVLNHCLSIDSKYFPQWEQLIDFNKFFNNDLEKEEFFQHYGQDGESKKSLCVIMYLLSYFQETHQLNYWNRIGASDITDYEKKSISPLLEQSFSKLVNFSIIQSILKELQLLDPEKSSYYNPQTRMDLNNISVTNNDHHCKHFMDKAMEYQNKPLSYFNVNFSLLEHVNVHNPRLHNKLIFIFLWERAKRLGHNYNSKQNVSAIGSISSKFLWIEILEFANMVPRNYLTTKNKIGFIDGKIKKVELFYKRFDKKNKNI